jgi:hypothetical protein
MSESRTILIALLKNMCENNDHSTTLTVLQTLGKVKRAGYIDIDDMVLCLSYMSDITEPSPHNPFSIRSRCFYYLAKNEQTIMQRVHKYCNIVDEVYIDEQVSSMILRNNIYNSSQLDSFYKTLLKDGDDMSYRGFTELCTSYKSV